MRAKVITLAMAMFLAACGGDGDGGTGPGNGAAFKADVTGDVETSVQGDALYGEIIDPEAGAAFAVEMSEADPTGGALIQILKIGAGVPVPGSYALTDGINGMPGDGDWVAAAYDSENGALTAIFVATGGTVKVTDAGNGKFKGTFSFNAEGGLLEDPGTTLKITVKGQFNATEVGGPAALRLPALKARSR